VKLCRIAILLSWKRRSFWIPLKKWWLVKVGWFGNQNYFIFAHLM
jgi:hypothetical protein